MPIMMKIFIFEKNPSWGGVVGWGIPRWVGTIDDLVLKMSLEHETSSKKTRYMPLILKIFIF